jgi:phosphatidylserine/phosphatidylglycerophosphate/cardiolipin synthase-like enzyme
MEQAKVEILVANPFVERCHISTPLSDMSEKGINVKLVTRQPSEERKREYLSKLIKKGVSITYDSSIHAKVIVVDHCVAIESSMNFFASSSGGASWEAGLVTIEKEVVQSIAHSILETQDRMLYQDFKDNCNYCYNGGKRKC